MKLDDRLYIGFARLPEKACHMQGLYPRQQNFLITPDIEALIDSTNLVELQIQTPDDLAEKAALVDFVRYARVHENQVVAHAPFLQISQNGPVHLSFFNGDEASEAAKQTILFCRNQGINYVTMHASSLRKVIAGKLFQVWLEKFLPLHEFALENGVTLGVETGGIGREELVSLVTDHKVRITLDHSHALASRIDPILLKAELQKYDPLAVPVEHVSEPIEQNHVYYDAHKPCMANEALSNLTKRVMWQVRRDLQSNPSYNANIVCEFMASIVDGEEENVATMRRTLAQSERSPYVAMVCGLPSSGKTTYARCFEDALVYSTDDIRKANHLEQISAWRHNEYVDPLERMKVYEEVVQRAREDLLRGCNVVLDGTFGTLNERMLLYEMIEECRVGTPNLDFSVTCCVCPDERVALQRNAQKKDPIAPENYQRLCNEAKQSSILDDKYNGVCIKDVVPIMQYDSMTGEARPLNQVA